MVVLRPLINLQIYKDSRLIACGWATLPNSQFKTLNSHLPPWRSVVARALHRNRSLPQSRYLQLATLDIQQRPTNRTVVFRGWLEPQSQLKFITDIRSAKAISLLSLNLDRAALNWAEACWYFPKTREQIRVSGTLSLITATCTETGPQQARQETWQQMSENGRIQFVWPTPGAKRSTDPQVFDPPAPDPHQPGENFCLLLLTPTALDHLELRGEPQNRCLYTSIAGEWRVEQVNP